MSSPPHEPLEVRGLPPEDPPPKSPIPESPPPETEHPKVHEDLTEEKLRAVLREEREALQMWMLSALDKQQQALAQALERDPEQSVGLAGRPSRQCLVRRCSKGVIAHLSTPTCDSVLSAMRDQAEPEGELWTSVMPRSAGMPSALDVGTDSRSASKSGLPQGTDSRSASKSGLPQDRRKTQPTDISPPDHEPAMLNVVETDVTDTQDTGLVQRTPPLDGGTPPGLNLGDESDDSNQEREEWTHHLQQQMSKNLNKINHGRRSRGKRSTAKTASSKGLQLVPQLRVVVESMVFQGSSAGFIVLNVLFIGYTTNASMRNILSPTPEAEPGFFEVVNTIFTTFFCVELLLRILAYGSDFVRGPDRKWNAVDTALSLSSLAEMMMQDMAVGIGALRMIRGLRMFRILRVLRVMRYCRDLRLMFCSILQSLGSLTWALILLMIIMYLFSVVFMQGAVLFFIDQHESNEPLDVTVKEGVELWYSSVFGTMYTMLASIVSGVGWVDVVRPLEEISMVYRCLFAFYIVFTVIGVLNVLTGIFVERACELSGLDKDLVIQSQLKRNETFFSEMTQIFEEADADGSGTIDWMEFKGYLENERVKAYLSTQQLDAFDARTLFDMICEGKSKEMSIESFIVGCQRLKGSARSVDLLAVLQETRALSKRVKSMSRALETAGVIVQVGSRRSSSSFTGTSELW